MVVDLRFVERRVGDEKHRVLQYRHMEGPAGRIRWSEWKDVRLEVESGSESDVFIPEPTD